MSNKTACWNITLNTTCPKCNHYFDMIEADDDFWDYALFGLCECDTPATTNYECTCPECEHEFIVDFTY